MEIWWLHDRLNESMQTAQRAAAEISRSKYVEDEVRIKEARSAYAEALEGYAELLTDMLNRGFVVPAIHQQTHADMKSMGISYEGPTYPGPGKGSV